MAFDFKRHLIKVQGGRTYLPVSARIVWFREQHPDWGVITEAVEINHEKQYAVFRATIFNAEGKIMATGTKKEDVKGFGDYMEKAETGAVGRALALCGFGTQFSPELDEVGGGRLADSPQPMGGGNRYGNNSNNSGGGGGGNFGGGNRYGNGGGDGSPRFAPPREMSAPANNRPDTGSRDTSTRPDEGAPRAAAPPPAPRPAPVPTSAEDDEDDFEALIGSDAILDATEEDPFGDAAAAPAPRTGATATAVRAEVKSDGPPACGGCGKALTKAQNDLSIRNYGEALCPTCQREKPRTERAAVAGR